MSAEAATTSGGTVGGLLLAAGAGTRLGRPKALVELAGERLVDRGLRLLRAAGCDPLVVVSGAAELGPLAVPARPVANPQWESGLASSLRAGLAELAGAAPAVVISLVDTPLITATAITRLIASWRAGAVAVVASYQGQPRNPVLLDASVWPEVAAAATGDVGARAWLHDHLERVVLLACDDAGDPYDVDTADDLAGLSGRLTVRLEEDLACS